jgi:2,4-dienoyl-CoA reductase-like NADH-dependent reductase (Old Yellow Enzyme family)
MCQYSADEGKATAWHMIHLGQLALSGAGLLLLEASAVTPEGRITAADLGLWSEQHQAALAPIVAAIRQHAPIKLGIQLGHAGRKASSQVPWEGGASLPAAAPNGWQTWAPSAVPHAPNDPLPFALDTDGMNDIKQAFVDAAERAHALGFEVIEVHAAHGYLLHQFLSPIANHRTDEYGGSLENRMRFPLEVFAAVRAAVPASVAVGVRISASDWVDGGWDIEQSVTFSQRLKEAGTAYMHVSSGGISPLQQIPLEAGYQIAFAARIKQETGLPTIGVGLITEPAHAEAIVSEGQADMVALARAMLYDPRWPWHAAAELGAQVDAPHQYWRCQPRELKNLFFTATHGQR